MYVHDMLQKLTVVKHLVLEGFTTNDKRNLLVVLVFDAWKTVIEPDDLAGFKYEQAAIRPHSPRGENGKVSRLNKNSLSLVGAWTP